MNALALCSFIRLINLGEEGRGLPLASAIRARIYCQFPAIFSIRIEQFGANCYGSADSIINPPSLCRRNSPQKFRNNISAVGCRSPNVCPTSSERLKGEDGSISRQLIGEDLCIGRYIRRIVFIFIDHLGIQVLEDIAFKIFIPLDFPLSL